MYVVIAQSPSVDVSLVAGPFRSMETANKAARLLDGKGYNTKVCEVVKHTDIDYSPPWVSWYQVMKITEERMEMKTCQHCGAQIHFESGPKNEPSYPYVWVDNSGGDVCGWDGANAPHEPADDEGDA